MSRSNEGTRVRRYLAFLTLLLVASTAPTQQAEEVAGADGLYVRLADRLVADAVAVGSETPEGRDLLDRAISIDPQNGDAYYLIAAALKRAGGDRAEQEELLRSALERRILRTDPLVIEQEIAEILVDTGRYSEAMRFMEGTYRSRFGAVPIVVDTPGNVAIGPEELNRMELLYLEALLAGGPRWYAGEYVRRLRGRFPDDPHIATLDFSREERVSLSALEWLDRRHQEGVDLPSRLLLESIVKADDPVLRRDLADMYRSTEDTDPIATIAAEEPTNEELSVLISTADDSGSGGYPGDTPPPSVVRVDKYALELFLRWNPDRPVDDLEALLQRPPDPDKGGTSSEPSEYVVYELDEDRDGYHEERYHVVEGRLALWEYDRFQDGRVDIRIELRGPSARPNVTVAIHDDGYSRLEVPRDDRPEASTVTVLVFSPYPRVGEVWIADASGPDRWMYPEIRRWRPGRPVAGTFHIGGVLDEGWTVLRDRLEPAWERYGSFHRQLEPEEAVTLGGDEYERYRSDLRRWEMTR